jgi:hypothetical protein
MELQQKKQKSLDSRVNDYLRGKPATFAIDESEDVAIEVIFDQLRQAEESLKSAQQRVDRLKWELAKAKS